MSEALEKAYFLQSQRRPAEAERLLRDHISGEPNDSELWAMLADCIGDQSRWAEAHEAADRAIELDPTNSTGWYAKARLWYRETGRGRERRLKSARQAAEQFRRLEPTAPEPYQLLGSILYALDKLRHALDMAEQGLRLDPEHAPLLSLRARILIALGRKPEAGTASQAALTHAPDQAHAHLTRGLALLERNRPADATQCFTQALRLNPNLEGARRGLVQSFRRRDPFLRLLLRVLDLWDRIYAPLRWLIVLVLFFSGALVICLLFLILVLIGFAWADLRTTAHPFGRMIQRPEDRTYGRGWSGLVLMVVLPLIGAALGAALATVHPHGMLLAMLLAALIPLPLLIRALPRGRPRNIMIAYALLTGALVVYGLIAVWTEHIDAAIMMAAWALLLGAWAGCVAEQALRCDKTFRSTHAPSLKDA